jgi:hypothetical protein
MEHNLTDEERAKSLQVRRNKTVALKKAMVDALKSTLGVVTPASEITGIARETHYKWYDTDQAYKKQVDSIKDIALDFAESKLHQSIKGGSDTANIFFLKTQGKRRGYIERSEIEMSGGMNVNWSETKTYDGTDQEANPGDRHPGGPED